MLEVIVLAGAALGVGYWIGARALKAPPPSALAEPETPSCETCGSAVRLTRCKDCWEQVLERERPEKARRAALLQIERCEYELAKMPETDEYAGSRARLRDTVQLLRDDLRGIDETMRFRRDQAESDEFEELHRQRVGRLVMQIEVLEQELEDDEDEARREEIGQKLAAERRNLERIRGW